MNLRYLPLGKLTEDFRPERFSTVTQFQKRITDIMRGNFTRVIAPRCEFTNNIVAFAAEKDQGESRFFWSRDRADGAIVEKAGEGVVIFNADCPVVSVFEVKRNRLAVLHVGFRSLFSPGEEKMNIIQRLFESYDFPRESVSVLIGFGIGPCCYGVHEAPTGVPAYVAERGPRKGKPSIDLKELIRKEFMACGVSPTAIRADSGCTACAGRRGDDDPNGNYHSYCWDGETQAGRNAIFIGLNE
jgi:copper oxidase (laccase) domain-containing protein